MRIRGEYKSTVAYTSVVLGTGSPWALFNQMQAQKLALQPEPCQAGVYLIHMGLPWDTV